MSANPDDKLTMAMELKTAINVEFQRLYDEGMVSGKHGHYETMFGAMHRAYAPYLSALEPSPSAERMREALILMRKTLVYGMERAERDWCNPDKAEAAHEMAEQLLTMFDFGLGFTPSELAALTNHSTQGDGK